MKYLEKAAFLLHFDYIPIKDVKPSHVLLLLEQCGKIKDRWSNNTYNTYIKYLSILFSYLVQVQAMEYNPARQLKKKKITRQLRRILNPEEGSRIDKFLKQYDENLWRFVHIFFHSGSRITEILKVQAEHVDLERQRVQYLILKGQEFQGQSG